MNRALCHVLAAAMVIAALAACGGPEEKKAKFHGRAQEFLDKGDLVKARLEVKKRSADRPQVRGGLRAARAGSK